MLQQHTKWSYEKKWKPISGCCCLESELHFFVYIRCYCYVYLRAHILVDMLYADSIIFERFTFRLLAWQRQPVRLFCKQWGIKSYIDSFTWNCIYIYNNVRPVATVKLIFSNNLPHTYWRRRRRTRKKPNLSSFIVDVVEFFVFGYFYLYFVASMASCVPT